MKPDQKQDCKVLTSERAIATATPAERTAHAKCIAEGYIESARQDRILAVRMDSAMHTRLA